MNWMRLNSSCIASASVRISSVLPRPGTPSSRAWPPANRHTSTPSTMSAWPTITLWISWRRASNWLRKRSAACLTCSGIWLAMFFSPVRRFYSIRQSLVRVKAVSLRSAIARSAQRTYQRRSHLILHRPRQRVAWPCAVAGPWSSPTCVAPGPPGRQTSFLGRGASLATGDWSALASSSSAAFLPAAGFSVSCRDAAQRIDEVVLVARLGGAEFLLVASAGLAVRGSFLQTFAPLLLHLLATLLQ